VDCHTLQPQSRFSATLRSVAPQGPVPEIKVVRGIGEFETEAGCGLSKARKGHRGRHRPLAERCANGDDSRILPDPRYPLSSALSGVIRLWTPLVSSSAERETSEGHGDLRNRLPIGGRAIVEGTGREVEGVGERMGKAAHHER
jgi:hypothetical protein